MREPSKWQRPRVKLLSASEIAFDSHALEEERFERVGEGHYQLVALEVHTDLEVLQVRRERSELRAELRVGCSLPGVKTVDGLLFFASVNLSSLRDRDGVARSLYERTVSAKVEMSIWRALVDELALRVAKAEQTGAPALTLAQVTPRGPDEWHYALGFTLPKRHPSMVFGDGDTLKTYTANAIAVRLAQQGIRVGILDWEMSDQDHRERVERLNPAVMDQIVYIACTRPLVHERDRVAEVLHEHDVQYIICDSVGFACHDKPESAESAMAYFREVRALGVGSFHIAHIAKGEKNDQKPFGSQFWFNSVRALWYAKRADAAGDGAVVEVGLYPRKFNLGARQRAFALQFAFGDTTTHVSQRDVADNESLASSLSIKDRISHILKSGAQSIEDLALAIDRDADSVRRTVHRYLSGNQSAKVWLFHPLPDGRIGLRDTPGGPS